MIKGKIGIVTITKRYGGLDILIGSLANQTYKNFTLYLVDTLHTERWQEVKAYAEKKGVDVYHIIPNRDPKDHGYIAEARNNGLAYAGDCEFYTLMDDYYYLDPEVLQQHIFAQQVFGKEHPAIVTAGELKSYYSYPVVNPEGGITTFAKCMEDPFPDSLIDERYTYAATQLLKTHPKYETDLISLHIGGMQGIATVNANFMVRMEEMQKINGADERLIGHGYDDTDVLSRLMVNGNRIYLINKAMVRFMDHPHRLHASKPSEEFIRKKIQNLMYGFEPTYAPNGWDVKEQQMKILIDRLQGAKAPQYIWKQLMTGKQVEREQYGMTETGEKFSGEKSGKVGNSTRKNS